MSMAALASTVYSGAEGRTLSSGSFWLSGVSASGSGTSVCVVWVCSVVCVVWICSVVCAVVGASVEACVSQKAAGLSRVSSTRRDKMRLKILIFFILFLHNLRQSGCPERLLYVIIKEIDFY